MHLLETFDILNAKMDKMVSMYSIFCSKGQRFSPQEIVEQKSEGSRFSLKDISRPAEWVAPQNQEKCLGQKNISKQMGRNFQIFFWDFYVEVLYLRIPTQKVCSNFGSGWIQHFWIFPDHSGTYQWNILTIWRCILHIFPTSTRSFLLPS